MSAVRNQGDLFDAYFRKADLDGNGKISGSEAVGFFQGANLPQKVLFQIWNYADQSRTGSLGRPEFYNALKLVTVAQSKRELTPDIVKAALYGPASAKIPAPQINMAAIPAPHSNAAGTTPSASQMAYAGSSASQNPRLTPAMPNTTMNQQYSPSTGNGLMGPPNSVSGVATRPQGGDFQGFHVGARPLGSNQAGLPLGAAVPVASLPSKPPVASGVPPHSTTQLRPPITQNGFAPGPHFGGDAFSKDGLMGTSSAGGMLVSSTSAPNPAGGLSVGGEHSKMQSHVKEDAQMSVPNIRQSGPRPPIASPQTSTGHQPQLQWPRVTQADIQKYTKVFMAVDTDKDGKITGDQARNLFLSWKLPREVLKQVWSLSDQDNDNMLSVREFCIALYLMERYREGRPLPEALPSSVMPDFSANAQPPSGYVNPSMGYSAGFQQPQAPGGGQRPSARPPGKPPLPFSAPAPLHEDKLPPKPQKAKVPVLEKHFVDQLSEEEQKSLNLKFQEASEANKKVEDLEKEIKESREKMEYYRVKMQELVLYKSRCDNHLNEVTERAALDKREVESLAKKYEEKYLQAGNVASRLTIEEATFRDIQERKMEMYQAVVKMDQEESDETLQVRADRIQSNLEDLVKSLSERCKKYGLRSKPTTLVELPFGWQPGIQEGTADWDDDWDKFEDEGFTFVKEMTLDVQNVIAPPKPKVKIIKKEKASSAEGEVGNLTSDATSKPMSPVKEDGSEAQNGVTTNQRADNDVNSHVASPSAKRSHEHDSPRNGFKSQSEAGVGDASSSTDKRVDEPTSGTFDTSGHNDSNGDSSKVNGRGRLIDDLFGHGEFTLPPIRTSSTQVETFSPNKKTVFPDSASTTPAEIFLPKSSIFDNSVPSTPAEGFYPKQSIFADSVPSTPLFNSNSSPHKDADERGFNFSRFDSFRSSDSGFQPQEKFSRFDSFRSTTELDSHDNGAFQPSKAFSRFDSMNSTSEFDSQDNGPFQPNKTFSRFDSINSTAEFDSQDNGPFQPNKTFSRFDSVKSTADSDFNHQFSSFDDSDPFGSGSGPGGYKSSFGSETPRSEVDPFGSDGPFGSSFTNETPRADSDPFGSTGPFRSSLSSETPRADSDFYSSGGPFRSSFGNETPRAETDHFGSVGPFGSSFSSETPRKESDHFGSVGPFGSSFSSETPRKESDYFGYSGSFKSSFDNETPRSEFDSFGFGGPFSSSFSAETPRQDSDRFGSSGPFKSSVGNEAPKGGKDSWSAF